MPNTSANSGIDGCEMLQPSARMTVVATLCQIRVSRDTISILWGYVVIADEKTLKEQHLIVAGLYLSESPR